MPPRRKKSQSRRRRFSGVNVLKLAETYALTNVWTQAAFRTNPWQFLTGSAVAGSSTITLTELLNPKGRFYDIPAVSGVQGPMYYITKNLGDGGTSQSDLAKGLVMTGLQSAGVSIGFRLMSKLTRKPRSMLNAQIRALGAGDMVRV